MCSLLRVDKIDADISDKDTKLFTEYIMHSYESAEKKAASAISAIEPPTAIAAIAASATTVKEGKRGGGATSEEGP